MNFKIPQLVVGILRTINTKRYEMVHWTHLLQSKPRKPHIVQHEHCIDLSKPEKQNFTTARVIIKNIYINKHYRKFNLVTKLWILYSHAHYAVKKYKTIPYDT